MVQVVGYGSLVNKDSLRNTVDYKGELTPILVEGIKRIFNTHIAEKNGMKALNVMDQQKFFINAVLLTVSDEEFQALMKRERHYTVKDINVHCFHSKEPKGKAMIFFGRPEFDDATFFMTEENQKRYFEVCRHGAYQISDAFGKYWDETTFIGNLTVKEFLERYNKN